MEPILLFSLRLVYMVVVVFSYIKRKSSTSWHIYFSTNNWVGIYTNIHWRMFRNFEPLTTYVKVKKVIIVATIKGLIIGLNSVFILCWACIPYPMLIALLKQDGSWLGPWAPQLRRSFTWKASKASEFEGAMKHIC